MFKNLFYFSNLKPFESENIFEIYLIGGICMKFLYPLGRKPGNGGATPQACQCSNSKELYSATRTGNDGCIHCGCSCGNDGEYRTGNRVNAIRTFRSSTI